MMTTTTIARNHDDKKKRERRNDSEPKIGISKKSEFKSNPKLGFEVNEEKEVVNHLIFLEALEKKWALQYHKNKRIKGNPCPIKASRKSFPSTISN